MESASCPILTGTNYSNDSLLQKAAAPDQKPEKISTHRDPIRKLAEPTSRIGEVRTSSEEKIYQRASGDTKRPIKTSNYRLREEEILVITKALIRTPHVSAISHTRHHIASTRTFLFRQHSRLQGVQIPAG